MSDQKSALFAPATAKRKNLLTHAPFDLLHKQKHTRTPWTAAWRGVCKDVRQVGKARIPHGFMALAIHGVELPCYGLAMLATCHLEPCARAFATLSRASSSCPRRRWAVSRSDRSRSKSTSRSRSRQYEL